MWFFFLFGEEIRILRRLWEGNVTEQISFQTWHTLVNIRTEIKVRPLPTAVHPQQIWQSAPIVWPWPITDNGSPPEPPPPPPPSEGRTGPARTQSCGLRSTRTAACWWTHKIWHVSSHALWQPETDHRSHVGFFSRVSVCRQECDR